MGDAKRALPMLPLSLQKTKYTDLNNDIREAILKRTFSNLDYADVCGSLMKICVALTGTGTCGEYAPIWDFVCKHFGLGVLGTSQPNSYSKLRQFCDELKHMYKNRDKSLIERSEPEWILQFNARDVKAMQDSLQRYIERGYALILEASIGLGVDYNVVLPKSEISWNRLNALGGYYAEPMRPIAYAIMWDTKKYAIMSDTTIFDYLLTLPEIDLGNERMAQNSVWNFVAQRVETEPQKRVPCISPFLMACGYHHPYYKPLPVTYLSRLLKDGRAPLLGFREEPPNGLPDLIPLAIAVTNGGTDVVRFILDRIDDRELLNAICKSDPIGEEAWDCSIIHAIARGHTSNAVDKMKLLLADDRIDKNLINDDGLTPLMYALAWCGWNSTYRESALKLVADMLEHPEVKANINAMSIVPASAEEDEGGFPICPPPMHGKTRCRPASLHGGQRTALDIFRQQTPRMGTSVRHDRHHEDADEVAAWADLAPRMEQLLSDHGAKTAREVREGGNEVVMQVDSF